MLNQLENHDSIYATFLQLIMLGIGTSKDVNIPNDVDCVALKSLADRHGLSAIVLDGLNEVLKSLYAVLSPIWCFCCSIKTVRSSAI